MEELTIKAKNKAKLCAQQLRGALRDDVKNRLRVRPRRGYDAQN
jgi:hypothetical protein